MKKLVSFLTAAILLVLAGRESDAQSAPPTISFTPGTLQYFSDTELTGFMNMLAATPVIAATNLSPGTSTAFFSLQHPEWPPFPGDVESLPVWDAGGGLFLLSDLDTSYDPGSGMRLFGEEPPVPGDGWGTNSSGDFGSSGMFQVFTTNDLWLQITRLSPDRTAAFLVIHLPWNNTNVFHDLYFTELLNPPVHWQFTMRCPYTNMVVTDLCPEGNGFFRLGPQTNGVLSVSTNVTAAQLAQLLVPSGITVMNATFTGTNIARGTFAGGNGCGLPLDSGVILSTGPITNAIGTNSDDGSIAYGHLGDGPSKLNQPGDFDLDNLTTVNGTSDAAVLEFDVISTNGFLLGFQYVFASEEYPEYIGSFNDPMAIFVSTNRISGNWINNITNDFALVPGTTNVLVSVNNINGGCVSNTASNYDSPTNPQYYADNHDPHPYIAMPPYFVAAQVFNVQYDGLTVMLTAKIPIAANVTNHVKIAIADYSDFSYDSAIFIKQWSPCQF